MSRWLGHYEAGGLRRASDDAVGPLGLLRYQWRGPDRDRETRHRLHQPLFRATVLRTYAERCARILGIRPDLVVQIRPELLAEIDGPMLLHGLQGGHGQPFMVVPRARSEQSDPQRLDQGYAAFLAAG